MKEHHIEVYKLIIFIHFKCYRPSSTLSYRQNLHASCSMQRTSHHELVNLIKILPVLDHIY
jgi:hypothetical protein